MENIRLSIYIPELRENYNAIWKGETTPKIGDIIKVHTQINDTIIYYAVILNIDTSTEEPKFRDFLAYDKE